MMYEADAEIAQYRYLHLRVQSLHMGEIVFHVFR